MRFPEPEILAVTYHYIAGETFPGLGVHPFGVDRFQKQVELMARTCRFLSLEDLARPALPSLGTCSRYAVLTFDDGLAEQFELAWPLLQAMGIPGAFFPCTAPLKTGKFLHVHRMHALRSAMADGELLALFRELAREKGFETSAKALKSRDIPVAPYPYDTPGARVLKSLFNYSLPVAEREALSESAFRQAFGEEPSWADDFYMRPEMLIELSGAGCLGTHTHSHRPLSGLDRGQIGLEIRESLDLLEETTGKRPFAVSYPYGNRLSVSADVFETAAECGVSCGFTTERRTGRVHSDRLRLPRFDAEDISPGKNPVFML